MSALLSAESFNRLTHDLNRRLYEMVLGTDPLERQAAIVAIGSVSPPHTFLNGNELLTPRCELTGDG